MTIHTSPDAAAVTSGQPASPRAAAATAAVAQATAQTTSASSATLTVAQPQVPLQVQQGVQRVLQQTADARAAFAQKVADASDKARAKDCNEFINSFVSAVWLYGKCVVPFNAAGLDLPDDVQTNAGVLAECFGQVGDPEELFIDLHYQDLTVYVQPAMADFLPPDHAARVALREELFERNDICIQFINSPAEFLAKQDPEDLDPVTRTLQLSASRLQTLLEMKASGIPLCSSTERLVAENVELKGRAASFFVEDAASPPVDPQQLERLLALLGAKH